MTPSHLVYQLARITYLLGHSFAGPVLAHARDTLSAHLAQAEPAGNDTRSFASGQVPPDFCPRHGGFPSRPAASSPSPTIPVASPPPSNSLPLSDEDIFPLVMELERDYPSSQPLANNPVPSTSYSPDPLNNPEPIPNLPPIDEPSPPVIVISSDEEDAAPPLPVADPLPPPSTSPENEICHICTDRVIAGITNCGHRFCGECLSHYQATRQGRIPCPDCRTPVTSFDPLPGSDPHDFVPLEVISLPPPPPENFINQLFLTHWGVTPNGEGIHEFPHTHLIRCRVCNSTIRNEAYRRYRHVLRCHSSPFRNYNNPDA